MKSRFALLAMMVIAAAPLAAQGGGGGGGGGMGGGRGGFARGIMNDSTMTSVLGLSADQHTKYKALLDAYNAANQGMMTYMRSARQGGGEISPDSTKKQADMRAKLTADLKALLTAGDQQRKFDSVVAATPQGGGRRGGGGGGI
jgi:hypothetical protein